METIEMCLVLFLVILISICFLRYDMFSKLLKIVKKITSLDQLENRIQALEAQALKAPVAFLVHTVSNINSEANTKLRFIDTVTNTGGAYDHTSGYFTAPVSGTYWFSVQISPKYQKSFHVQIYADNRLIGSCYMYHDSGGSCSTTNAVAVLNVGDKVHVQTGDKPSYIEQNANRWAVFSGALVH